MPSTVERKLAAIMFTDIAGYTALSAKDEKKALKLLDIQTENIYPIIETFDGTINKTVGDGLLITFPTVTSAHDVILTPFEQRCHYRLSNSGH